MANPLFDSVFSTPAWAWTLHASGVRERLRETDLHVLATVCPPRTYRRGDHVYRLGDAADDLYVLIDGSVKLSAPARLGGERVLAVCGPDDFFGESFLTGGSVRNADAVCLDTGTVVCAISRDAFLTLARQSPGVVLAFTAAFAARAHDLQERLGFLSHRAEMRLARVFLDLAVRLGQGPQPGLEPVEWVTLSLDVRHEDLAGLAHMSRATVTEVLSQWRALGLLVGTRGEYQVNVGGLSEWCDALEHRDAGGLS